MLCDAQETRFRRCCRSAPDYEMKADKGLWKLPIAIISKRNYGQEHRYRVLANAGRGYLSCQHQQDLPATKVMTRSAALCRPDARYTALRKPTYFCARRDAKRPPNADYDQLTLDGNYNGATCLCMSAKHQHGTGLQGHHPDNLRVPFVLSDRMKILRTSKDQNFKTSRRPACPRERQVGATSISSTTARCTPI